MFVNLLKTTAPILRMSSLTKTPFFFSSSSMLLLLNRFFGLERGATVLRIFDLITDSCDTYDPEFDRVVKFTKFAKKFATDPGIAVV